jgi:ubiquinone/menaquinone biosynthesis C-methylase UbiE
MSESESTFDGSVPQIYQEKLVPLIFEEYAEDLAGRVKVPSDGVVLETACGTGVVTRHLRRLLPEGTRIIATDFSPDMLAIARDSMTGQSAIEFDTADATALTFSDDSIDCMVCQFGIMFFPDLPLAYSEAARVIKPGGTFIFSIWDSLERNRLPQIGHETLYAMFGDDRPGFLEIPFGYDDLAEIRDALQLAGFADIDISVMPRISRAPSARDVATAIAAGTPLAAALAERGAQQEVLEKFEAAIIEEFGDGEIAAPMQATAITARLPSR